MVDRKKSEFLTEVELEFMNQLWKLGEANVREVQEHLAADRNLAYTSCATILRILSDKGFATSTKRGKTYYYRPVLAKDDYQTRSLKRLSAKLFDDAPARLVAHLVDDAELSLETLAEIRELLDRRLVDGSS